VHEQDSWLSVWAKTGQDPLNPKRSTHWLPPHQHVSDTSVVAGLLVDRWFSPQVIGYCSREIDGGAARVRRLVRWLAAVHDVGQASPAFAVQDDLADAMRAHGLAADPRYKADPQRTRVRREMVGQQAVRVWLTEELGSTSGEQPLLWAV
jgi:CRISPR-associated endonuclease/helicase Cas3